MNSRYQQSNQVPATPQFLNDILKQLSNKPTNITNNNPPFHQFNNNYNHLNRKQPIPNRNHTHLNNRKKRNTSQQSNKTKTIQSRSWFACEDDWAQGNTIPIESPSFLLFGQEDTIKQQDSNKSIVSAFDFFKIQKKGVEPSQKSSVKTIIVNTDQSVCPICEEELEKSYDSQRMNWVMNDVEFSPSLQLYLHSNCFDSKKRKVQTPFESSKKVKI